MRNACWLPPGWWLQSIGGSLRLPLLQNGACPFPGTPLLSALMLVTHTPREIVSTLPRFRIVAVPMKRLHIARAPIASIPINMIDLDPVIMVEAQLTIPAASVLLFEELGQSSTDTRVPSSSLTPVHPVAIIGTPVPTDFDVPSNSHLTMGEKVYRIRIRGGCGKGETVVHAMPVPLPDPSGGCGGVSSVRPA